MRVDGVNLQSIHKVAEDNVVAVVRGEDLRFDVGTVPAAVAMTGSVGSFFLSRLPAADVEPFMHLPTFGAHTAGNIRSSKSWPPSERRSDRRRRRRHRCAIGGGELEGLGLQQEREHARIERQLMDFDLLKTRRQFQNLVIRGARV